MRLRSLLILPCLMTGSFLSFGTVNPVGHGHGGGHGHTMGHFSHHSSSHSGWAFHQHYHPAYHHRCGDHYYAGNTGNRYNHSAVYRNPLRGEQEISIGCGIMSANQLQDSALQSASPTCFLTYRYYISNGFSLGLSAGIQSLRGSSIYENNNLQLMPFTYNQLNTTIAAEATFLYCSRGIFQAYGLIGLGWMHWTENGMDQDNTSYTEAGDKFAYQVTPFGFRVGRSLGVFAEFGVGYKGLVFGGISYQAGWKKAHPFYNPEHY